MSLLSGINDFFGLDIGSTAIRLVQLGGNGQIRSLIRYGTIDIDERLVMSEARADQQKLAATIHELVAQAGVLTRNVTVGLPSSKVFTTVAEFDDLKADELAKTIHYQADGLIPTPIVQSKIDWARLGPSPKEQGKVEVLLSSVTNDFIEARLDMLESIGLNVIAFEPDTLALSRSLSAPDVAQPQLVIDMGNVTTDLVVTMNGAPHLVRSIPTGTQAVIKAAVQTLGIDERQAKQFVFKFGLSKDKLEGQVYSAIFPTMDILVSEVEKSIKYFQSRYPNIKLERIIMTGDASILPEFPLHVANRFGLGVEIGNAWRNIAIPPERQNELAAVANHFSVAAGLAERIE